MGGNKWVSKSLFEIFYIQLTSLKNILKVISLNENLYNLLSRRINFFLKSLSQLSLRE